MAKQKRWLVQEVTNAMTKGGLKVFFKKGRRGHLGNTLH